VRDDTLSPAPSSTAPDTAAAAAVRDAFRAALAGFRRDDGPVLVMGHNDADGLSAAAIFVRALRAAGWAAEPRILGRGENPWSAAMRAELDAGPRLGGLVVTDLGTRPGAIKPGTPTVVVDHHVPTGTPEGAALITGHPFDPIPTSSLLAYWCAGAVAGAGPLLWLAALGLIGDMAEKSGFPEMEEARRAYGVTKLRDAVSLLNAPRRSASGDAGPALALLLKADGPKEILSGEHPETTALHAAKEEVKAELEAAKRVGPKVRNGVALIRFHSPCQIHPLVAQAWRGRLKDDIVLAANTGYRPGWVHFAARSARGGVDLIRFLAEHAPPGADENYGSGHAQATGGALRPDDWNHFVAGLGFGPEQQVQAG
jgi:single-stranded-DNA-specific exonuclease